MELNNSLGKLICPNCQLLNRPSYKTCVYGHFVCQHCKKHSDTKAKLNNKVKKCKSNVIELPFLDVIFMQILDNCQHNCGYRGKLLSLGVHESSCKNELQSTDLILNDSEISCKDKVQNIPKDENVTTNQYKLEIKNEKLEDLSENITAMDFVEVNVKQEDNTEIILPNAELNTTDNKKVSKSKKKTFRHFICDKCGKIFKNTGNLRAHLRIHSKIKPHSCNLCTKSFNGMSNLKRHLRIHTGEKPFSCHVCGKSFTEMGTLTRHLRIHSGVQPYSCHQCGRAFNAASSLAAHLRIHAGIRPFNCKICSKDFSRSTHLKTHMRVHNRVQ